MVTQGFEAGGHPGMFLTDDIATQPGTFALVPQVVDAVKVPVIAAGGIADCQRSMPIRVEEVSGPRQQAAIPSFLTGFFARLQV